MRTPRNFVRDILVRGTFCLSLVAVAAVGAVGPTAAETITSTDQHQGRSLDVAKRFISDLAQDSMQVLRKADDNAEQKQAKFEKLWNEGVSFDTISRFVLGRYWRAATPEQQERYQSLFAASIIRTSVNALTSLDQEPLKIVDARLAGKKDMLVSSRIIRVGGPSIPVDWRVRVIDGRYQVIDVMIEGVSMALTKRSEYSAVVKNQGLEGLLDALQSTI
jgi:phospholipid transport system substrate-binding protein